VVTGPEIARSEAVNLPGEFSALLQQIGAPVGCTATSPALAGLAPKNLPAPEVFLDAYAGEILLPLESRAIVDAFCHAGRGELRELIVQDQRLGTALRQTPFAGPSRQVGRRHLSRLRPLRDERTVQRYLRAVEAGQAEGWHTLVYGLTLAVYSLPLRQGLFFYARETLAALADAANGGATEAELGWARVLDDLLEGVPAAVAASLTAHGVQGPGQE